MPSYLHLNLVRTSTLYQIPLYDVPPRRLRQWRTLLRYSWSPTYDIVAILTNIQSLRLDSDPNSRMLRVRRGEGRGKGRWGQRGRLHKLQIVLSFLLFSVLLSLQFMLMYTSFP